MYVSVIQFFLDSVNFTEIFQTVTKDRQNAPLRV